MALRRWLPRQNEAADDHRDRVWGAGINSCWIAMWDGGGEYLEMVVTGNDVG